MLRPFRACLTAVLAAGATAQAGRNLLFYGNSYSARNGGVAALVRLIAAEAGHPAPNVVERLASSQDLHFHRTDPGQVAAITTALPPGQTWDAVILQGQSTEATAALGNPQQFRADAVGIAANVRSHSPLARAVLYQTWARAVGHHYYPGTFATPIAMHDEIRANYRLAAADIEAAFGTGAAVDAAVGDGVALLEWDPSYYESDLYHPLPAMTLLAGMCLYTSIYGATVCELSPSFAPAGPLASWLTGIGLSERDWREIAGIADRVADAGLRPYPGSGDHLLMESATLPGLTTACGRNRLPAGSWVLIRFRSLNGVYDAAPSWLLAGLFPTGSPPGPAAMYPEIRLDLGTMSVLATTASLGAPAALFTRVPFSWPGTSILVQGLAWGPSTATGNAFFTTTDGHESVFQ
ncbi:MAG: hypothetical protein KDE27_00820 [Planctomycetes bacterium]|nr:hypothetical protein [Planctomycetota bacterium]